jgi:hypothetical protein
MAAPAAALPAALSQPAGGGGPAAAAAPQPQPQPQPPQPQPPRALDAAQQRVLRLLVRVRGWTAVPLAARLLRVG